MYTDDRNAQIVLALLKEYNIKKIVVSPGITNVPIAGSVQYDPFFEVYSVVDERSAAYFATGLAFESGEPVVISCTGATASRNYLPALTEAYYRNLPIIALTSQRFNGDYDDLEPQLTNRTVSQKDVKRISINLPIIKDNRDVKNQILEVNKALTLATVKGGGPVHINLLVDSLLFTTQVLPNIPKIDFVTSENLLDADITTKLSSSLKDKKIGLLIGAHRKFTQKELQAVESFIETYDVAVFCDHTANYHGKNKILLSHVSDLKYIACRPEVVIDIGSIIGSYSAKKIFSNSMSWRISEDGVFHQRYGKLCKQFDCSEHMFFKTLANKEIKSNHEYYNTVTQEIGGGVHIPELPLSNAFLCSVISQHLPAGTSLHLSILNSLRNMNYFELDKSIDSVSNVGGFGIDGPVSTLVGQSMANHNRLYFGLIGDLAFFYDMNALGIRHIRNNLRIILISNGLGVEFRLSRSLEPVFGEKTNEYIAAQGHFSSAKGWVESMNFEYLSARNKSEFLEHSEQFFHADVNYFNKPVLLEVFTTIQDEQEALNLIRESNRSFKDNLYIGAQDTAMKILPKKVLRVLKKHLE